MKPIFTYLLSGLFLFSCAESNESAAVLSVGEAIHARIQLSAASMTSSNSGTSTRSAGSNSNSAMDVQFGSSQTRATADKSAGEKAIKTAYLLQFAGTEATSMLTAVPQLLKLESDGYAECNLTGSNAANCVYVVANLSPDALTALKALTTATTLDAFEKMIFAQSALTVEQMQAQGLPMTAVQNFIPSQALPGAFTLSSRMTKVTFSYAISDKLNFPSVIAGIANVPSGFVAKAGTAADAAAQPAAGVTYGAATIDLTAAKTEAITCYIPENLAGRNTAITQDSNRGGANAMPNSTYIDISGIGDEENNQIVANTFSIYLGDLVTNKGDFNVQGNYAYDVSVNVRGTNPVDKRVDVATYKNLSLDASNKPATANCYLVNAAGAYYIDATVMGNGATTPTNSKSAVVGDLGFPAITPPASASVLWETENTTVAPVAGSVVKGVKLHKNKLLFKGSAQGNAVIAVKNSGGTILWSWHLWRWNGSPKSFGLAAIGTLTTDNGLVMMDRNLGALSAAAGNDLSTGMYYQWGRKDPMPGGASLSSAATAMATQPSGIPGIASGGSIATAVANPTTFYTSNGDWCTPRTDNLWGTPMVDKVFIGDNRFNSNPGMKSIYDPCPVGWRVPPGYVFANAVKPTTAWDKGWNLTIGFGGVSSYFPASGSRNNDGTLYGVGTYGNYWASSPNATDASNGSLLFFRDSSVSPADGTNRARGCSVRCVEETKGKE